jgi:hypothetical protein
VKGRLAVKHRRILTNAVVWTALLLFVCAKHAHAYIDPGSGSYILQLIVAGLLGVGVAVRIYWKGIKAFILRVLSGRRGEVDDHE